MKKILIFLILIFASFAGADDQIYLASSNPYVLGGAVPVASGYDIGTAGAQDFGLAPYSGSLPSGFSAMTGSDTPGHDNYGNYTYSDNSVMVWIPKFYYKVTSPNSIDVKGTKTYSSTSAANSAGYALHRAFIDGSSEKAGFFIDKYKVSKTAKGTGYIASSIQNGLPISTSSSHNPIADLTASGGTNAHYRAIDCAHARDGVDGAVNASSIFHVASRFQYGALALLSLAHGQASSATTYNAWYHATNNFPKGCNNNSRADANDTSVIWESDGYSSACKTGSAGYGGGAGNLFAKSTHNGQNSGVSDLNGGMWEISLGVSSVSAAASITAATQANPCQITASSHGLSTGAYVQITSVGGMTQINDKMFKVTVVDSSNFTLDNVDSSSFGTYTSGGTARWASFYVAKEATTMKSFTSGTSSSTDHWGSTGIAAMMDSLTPAFETAYSSNGFGQRMGSGTNQVISGDTSGAGWLLAGLGFPSSASGIDTSGTSTFGQDYFYQYMVDALCLLSGGNWSDGSSTGVWASDWHVPRSNASINVGFRVACYP
jgi:hypothetical protein